MTAEDARKLLEDVRNYLDITYEDNETDRKLVGILTRGMRFLDSRAGVELDYQIEDEPRQLLFDYCRYVRNNSLEYFEHNFKAQLIGLRLRNELEAFVNGGMET